jgi:hypothetical protein
MSGHPLPGAADYGGPLGEPVQATHHTRTQRSLSEQPGRISTRTKEALAAYKAHGRISKRIKLKYPDRVPAAIVEATVGKLGASLLQCRNLTPERRDKGLLL